MSIPNFTEKGLLPQGIHLCSGDEFLNKFCSSENRKSYAKTFVNILDFAKKRNAKNIFIGGSFVTDKKNPSDIDCLIEFYKDRQIPEFIDCPISGETSIDILYSSAESPNLTDSFITLLSLHKFGGENVGIIQIDLNSKTEPWVIHFTPGYEELEIITRFYSDRHIIERLNKKGVLVTIHGLYSRAEWNMELLPAASSQGWVVAPYIYEENNLRLLFESGKRESIIEGFRNWIYQIASRYQTNISIIAHSFGTYIISKYIQEFGADCCPVNFDSIILTGSIINSNFNWDDFKGRRVGRVLNIVASKDDVVRFMPEDDWKTFVGIDKICGRSGRDGYNFSSKNNIVSEKKIDILNHTNIIKKDIIDTIMIPFINVNMGILNYEKDNII